MTLRPYEERRSRGLDCALLPASKYLTSFFAVILKHILCLQRSAYFNSARHHQGLHQQIPVPTASALPVDAREGLIMVVPVFGGLHPVLPPSRPKDSGRRRPPQDHHYRDVRPPERR
jgi:hypothetical protein